MHIYLKAITYNGSKWARGLLMAKASYCYTRSHGFSFLYALHGAAILCFFEWKRGV